MIVNEEGALVSPPIWVDFMNVDWERRVRLDAPGTERDLRRLGVELAEGDRLLLYQEDATDVGIDDLVTVGIAQFDPEENRWVAIVDWQSVSHVSELSPRNASLYWSFRQHASEQ
jgi:hypothetical protein